MKGLGKTQWLALKALKEKGPFPGSWMFDTHSQTETVLNSLGKYGLVEVKATGYVLVYSITKEGEEFLENRETIQDLKEKIREKEIRKKIAKELMDLMYSKETGQTVKPGLYFAATILDPSIREGFDSE